MSRDYDPVPGKWYEDLETEEIFKVLSLDPDEELVRIQWLDRELEDLDLDVWNRNGPGTRLRTGGLGRRRCRR